MTELERITKASFDDYSKRENKPECVDQQMWDDVGLWENQTDTCRKSWTDRTRAVLVAMKSVSAKAALNGWNVIGCYETQTPGTAAQAHIAMLDAIIGE